MPTITISTDSSTDAEVAITAADVVAAGPGGTIVLKDTTAPIPGNAATSHNTINLIGLLESGAWNIDLDLVTKRGKLFNSLGYTVGLELQGDFKNIMGLSVGSIAAASGTSNINGSALEDEVKTGNGNAIVNGMGGDDWIWTGMGNDTAQGGSGNDSISLNHGADTAYGGDGNDHLYGEEGDDALYGGIGRDLIDGGSGNNKLYGEAGDDILMLSYMYRTPGGGSIDNEAVGVNHVDGGAGSDAVIYMTKVEIDLAAGTAKHKTGTDTLVSIENVYTSDQGAVVYGTDGANEIVGAYGIGVSGNEFYGLGGDDIILGGGGDDLLDGGAGNDTIEGSYGVDMIRGGAGNDLIFGGVEDGSITDLGPNTLDGGDGDDELYGADGDDILIGGAGTNVLSGGAGSDTADYSSHMETIEVDYIAGTVKHATGTDTLIDIETILFGKGNDIIQGTEGVNSLGGGEGADRLFGLGGDDVLSGGDGNDTLYGGSGSNHLDGGNGSDVVKYDGHAASVTADLVLKTARHGSGTDTLVGIEGLVGGLGDDKLYGDKISNILQGAAGNDRLYGREGNDTLSGGDGNDSLYGGSGSNKLDGGAGSDAAVYNDHTGAITLDLVTGQAKHAGGTDALTGIESAVGGAGDDSISGDKAANILQGGLGNDKLYGREGNDKLYGGDGNDALCGGAGSNILDGGEGGDAVEYSDYSTAVTINLDAGTGTHGVFADKYVSIEHATGGTGSDKIYGSAVANMLQGGEGHDHLYGYDGGDKLYGEAGSDSLYGGSGNDRLEGGAGRDYLLGELGADTLVGGADADTFIFRAGDSTTAARDTISDFQTGIDKIDLRQIDANLSVRSDQAFSWIESSAFTKVAGQLRYDAGPNGITLSGDTNGDGVADFAVLLAGLAKAPAVGDIIL